MQVLLHGNAPFVPTGYGQQINLFARRLAALEDIELTISANFGLAGSQIKTPDGITVLPGIPGDLGDDTLPAHAKQVFGEFKNGLVIALLDVWGLQASSVRPLKAACWTPIDHDPLPPPVSEWFEGSQASPIAMSRFGEEKLREAGLKPIYVPHGVDTEMFTPAGREAAREATQWPADAFVVGMVAANTTNPSRKSFAEALLAFKRFHDKHPEAKLYLHTEVTGRHRGVNLGILVQSLGIPRDAIYLADQYRMAFDPWSPGVMAQIYSALDVLLLPSAGEGFGLPVLEAGACGVPSIVSDFSAQPEVLGAGWLVPTQPVYTKLFSWQVVPSVEGIQNALEQAFGRDAKERTDMAEKARTHALTYDADTVTRDYWVPALKKLRRRWSLK